MIFEKVKEVIVKTINCDADEVTMEASLSDDLGADSLDAVELNMAIEEELEVTIPDEALAGMKLVSDIVKYVEAQK